MQHRTPQIGDMVIFWPGVRRHHRPAIVAHVFATGDLGLHVCWAPTDGIRRVPDMVEYAAPVDGVGKPETWCWREDLLPQEDHSDDQTPPVGLPNIVPRKRKRKSRGTEG